MSSKPSSHASTSSQSQQPVWAPPRAPLPPHRLAKLANALGVAAPLPATGSSNSFVSQSAVSPGQQPPSPHADIAWRAGTPSVASTHGFAPSQSKYLLHVIPPAYLPHDSDAGNPADLAPPPPGASGYHTQFRRGILVSLQSTLQAQLIVIAREYALPSTLGIVLYLVCSSPQDRQNGATDVGEPGPRLSEDMWRHIWARVLRAEREEASTFSRSPTPNPLGLGLTVETNVQVQALRPLVTPTRTETPLPLPLSNLLTPSPTSASSTSDLRSQTKSAPHSTSQNDPDTPDTSHSSNQDLPGIELQGLKSPSIIPILAKVEFDIDRRRAGWYEPWLRSRRIAHAKRTESRSSNRTGSQSRNGDEMSPVDDRRAPFDLKLVERMQKPGFLRTTDESDEEQANEGDYAPLSGSPDGGNNEDLVEGAACMSSDKDPLIDVFGSDAETWARLHSDSEGRRKEVDPNVVELALDASSLAPLSSLADEPETGDRPNDAAEVQDIIHHMSGKPLPSPPTSRSKRPPPLVVSPNLPKGVVPDNHDLPSGRSSIDLPYVTGSTAPLTGEDSEFRNKEGLSLELEQEYLRSRSPAEDKRVGALFEGLDLGLDLDDEEEVRYDENDPNDRRRSQYLMKARLDEIERTLAQFSPRQLRTNAIDEDLTITHRRTLTNTISADAFGSKNHSPVHDRSMLHVNGAAWPAVPYSSVATSISSSLRHSDLPPSPPKLALNGATTGAPKSFVPPSPNGGASSETEARRREHGQSVYPTTVPAPFTRQTDLTSDSPIPLSPDPFGRYPSMYEAQTHPVSTYWDPTTKQFSEVPGDSRPSTSSVDEASLASTTQSSRFSADSSIAVDLADKGGKAQGPLASVKSLKRLWRRSKGSSTPQPPTPSLGMSFQNQLPRHSQEALGPPPVTTVAARNGKTKTPLNQFQFDQESPYPIHPGRPSLNGIRPISPPVPPSVASAEKTSVRKSILKSWKSVTGSQQNPGASDVRKSAERPMSNETVKPRRPSVLDNIVPPSPKLPEHLFQSNHARNGSGIFERRKSAGRSKMSSKANYSSSSQDMLGITSQQRSSIVMMQAPNSVSPSRSQFSASSMDFNTEGRGSFDTTSQFEVISAPKVHPNLTYPYQTLDYE
ncbi:hypothetical protein EV401DRAFT_2100772 [Pisolithus croceorrhizus]|nr:hypothetical protein EV401DRAFT_2100772 [Pisolithus croceorrhizus]